MTTTPDTSAAAEPLQAKFSLFAQLVELVRTRFIWVVLTLFIIGAAAFGYKAYKHFDDILNNAFPSHDFHTNLEVDGQIQSSLNRLRDETKADRVLIAQFHNGTHGDGALPFRSYSIQYADVAPGVSYDGQEFSNVPLSVITEINQDIWPKNGKPHCVKRSYDDLHSNILRLRWEKRGTHTSFYCPITSLEGTPVGLVIAGYLDRGKDVPADKTILSSLEDNAVRVAGYLQSAKLKT